MRISGILIALLIASPAGAQCYQNGILCGSVQQSDLDALAATIPTPMLTAPPVEAIGGAPGTAGTYRTGNAVQPRITRVKPFTTDANGQAVVTWTDMGAVPGVLSVPTIGANATQVPACYPVTGTITSTGATIQCFLTQTLLGLGLVPFAKATAGISGSVFAIPNS